MKRFIPHLFIFTCCVLFFSCLKKEVPPAPTIIANWSVVKDSTFFKESATSIVGMDTTVYIGQAGDYYNFASNGKVYIKEGQNLDTATYAVKNGNKVLIGYLLYPATSYSVANIDTVTYDVSNLTSSTLTLTNPGYFLAPIYIAETIYLRR